MPEENTILDSGSAEVDPGSGAGGESGGSEDSYDDLRGDPRVQKYVSDLHSKAVQHIPKEYREKGSFQKLMEAKDHYERMQKDPAWLAYQAGQNRDVQSQEKPKFSKKFMDKFGTLYRDLSPEQSSYMSDLVDTLYEPLMAEVEEKYFNPVRQYLGSQEVNKELEQARAMPKFSDHEAEIQALQEKYKYNLSWSDAYKIVTHGKQLQEAAEDAAVADSKRRAKASGEKPSGHGVGDLDLGKPKNQKEAREKARKALRSKGIDV